MKELIWVSFRGALALYALYLLFPIVGAAVLVGTAPILGSDRDGNRLRLRGTKWCSTGIGERRFGAWFWSITGCCDRFWEPWRLSTAMDGGTDYPRMLALRPSAQRLTRFPCVKHDCGAAARATKAECALGFLPFPDPKKFLPKLLKLITIRFLGKKLM